MPRKGAPKLLRCIEFYDTDKKRTFELFSIFTRLYDQNHTGTQHCKFENESVRTDSFPIYKDIRNSYIEFISSLFKLGFTMDEQ